MFKTERETGFRVKRCQVGKETDATLDPPLTGGGGKRLRTWIPPVDTLRSKGKKGLA